MIEKFVDFVAYLCLGLLGFITITFCVMIIEFLLKYYINLLS